VTDVVREWVSSASPVTRRNGAGFHPCQGLWHRPVGGVPRVAFIATHYNVDFSEHYLGELLARRGFGFLGWNTRFRGNEAHFLLDPALIEIGVGVRWLREVAGVESVVLLGNSGGGSLMAAYQSQACGVTMRPAPGLELHPALQELPPADLYVSLNAHGGRPEVMTAWMDASVADETDPLSVDAALDPFREDRTPPYDPAFVTAYRAGQAARNHRISAWARAELARLGELGVPDRTFLVHRVWADLRFMDATLDPSKRRPNRCYAGDPRRANFSPMNIGALCTLRTWLSMWSLEDSWCRGAPHLERITVPSLVVQSDADTGVFPSDARAIHDHIGAEDRALEMVPGDHYLQDPPEAREAVADLITDWVRARS
jgi:pimeloyl-ACP methyl ester carboxylesterase